MIIAVTSSATIAPANPCRAEGGTSRRIHRGLDWQMGAPDDPAEAIDEYRHEESLRANRSDGTCSRPSRS